MNRQQMMNAIKGKPAGTRVIDDEGLKELSKPQ